MKRKKKNRPRKLGFILLLILVMMISAMVFIRSLFPRPYQQQVEELSLTYALDVSLIYAVILTESNFRADAQSPAGAKGLMQITDETGEFIAKKLDFSEYTVEDLFNPEKNILMGTYYLSYLKGRFSRMDTVLAAYNAGPNRVAKWLEDETLSDGEKVHTIPFEETKNYVDRVLFRQKVYQWLYGTD